MEVVSLGYLHAIRRNLNGPQQGKEQPLIPTHYQNGRIKAITMRLTFSQYSYKIEICRFR